MREDSRASNLEELENNISIYKRQIRDLQERLHRIDPFRDCDSSARIDNKLEAMLCAVLSELHLKEGEKYVDNLIKTAEQNSKITDIKKWWVNNQIDNIRRVMHYNEFAWESCSLHDLTLGVKRELITKREMERICSLQKNLSDDELE